jgi:hypothetical protein
LFDFFFFPSHPPPRPIARAFPAMPGKKKFKEKGRKEFVFGSWWVLDAMGALLLG